MANFILDNNPQSKKELTNEEVNGNKNISLLDVIKNIFPGIPGLQKEDNSRDSLGFKLPKTESVMTMPNWGDYSGALDFLGKSEQEAGTGDNGQPIYTTDSWSSSNQSSTKVPSASVPGASSGLKQENMESSLASAPSDQFAMDSDQNNRVEKPGETEPPPSQSSEYSINGNNGEGKTLNNSQQIQQAQQEQQFSPSREPEDNFILPNGAEEPAAGLGDVLRLFTPKAYADEGNELMWGGGEIADTVPDAEQPQTQTPETSTNTLALTPDEAAEQVHQAFSAGRGGNIESVLYKYLVDNYDPEYAEAVGSTAAQDIYWLYRHAIDEMLNAGIPVIDSGHEDLISLLGTSNNQEALQFVQFCNDGWGMYSTLCDETGNIDYEKFYGWLTECRNTYNLYDIFSGSDQSGYRYAELFALDFDTSKAIADIVDSYYAGNQGIYSPEQIMALGAVRRFIEQSQNDGPKFNQDDIAATYQQLYNDDYTNGQIEVGPYSPYKTGDEYTANNMMPKEFWNGWQDVYDEDYAQYGNEEHAKRAANISRANWLMDNNNVFNILSNVPSGEEAENDPYNRALGLYNTLAYLGGDVGFRSKNR